jgi:hypothetical protein
MGVSERALKKACRRLGIVLAVAIVGKGPESKVNTCLPT